MIARALLAWLLLTAPAVAQSEGFCWGDAHSLDRELALRGDQLSANDRLLAEQRLSRARGQCTQDAPRAQQDLEQLRRDIIQQATRPGELPGVPHSGIERR